MNDISVKIAEFPKGAVLEAPLALAVGDREVDPLAIDDEEARSTEVEPVVEKPAHCDENAKEESPIVEQKNDDQKVPVSEDVKDNVTENLKQITEKLKELTKESKEVAELVEDTTSTKLEEPAKIETSSVTINAEDTDEPANPTPEPKADLPIQDIDPPTPDLNTPPPEREPEDISEPIPEPVKEVIEESPKATTPEAKVPEVTATLVPEPEPKTLIEKPVPPTNVEMMEVSVQLPQTVQLVKPVELSMPTPNIPMQVDVPTPSIAVKSQLLEPEVKMPVVELKTAQKETKIVQPINGDVVKEEHATKRRASEDVETDSPLKKLCLEVEKTFPQHDSMINDYIQTATKNNIDEIQRHTEQLLAEIQTLRELAQKKEHEWNNILHLKKVKEEILLRLLRRKQVLSFEKSAEINGAERPGIDPFDFLNQAKNLAIDKSDDISGLSIKQPGSTMGPMMQAPIMPVTTHFNHMAGLPPPYDKAAQMHMQNMQKPVFPQSLMMPGTLPGFPRDMNGQLTSNFNMPMGRQGPTKDVKSIIADYRQRNPDITPRRGRRMKSILNPNMMNAPRNIAPKVDQMNNMNNLNNLNMLFNNLDMNQKAMLERLQQIQAGGLPNSIFKDALVQFANMQQANSGLLPNRPPETITNRPEHHVKERRRERNHEQPKHQQQQQQQPERMPSTSPRLPPPPPYPEISLLPVSTAQEAGQSSQNSLLHGILTKPAPPQSFSPTLAKLLTSPERKQSASAPAVLPTYGQAKNCGEITITPVQPAPTPTPAPEPQPEKTEEVVQLDDEESPASEGEASGSPLDGGGGSSGGGRLVIDEGGAESDPPLCQGCRRRDAQFVCAGCANQWYCSRDCQVAAWDDHSEMCSG